MKFEVSCPSKTFILGEYLVLSQGSALLANTTPRFYLRVDATKKGTIKGIHPESPAGQWLRQHRIYIEEMDLTFRDPHNGLGGFGASSAQYLLAHLVTYILKNQQSVIKNTEIDLSRFQVEQVWRAYRQAETVSEEGLRPSGADVVSQSLGGLCNFRSEPFSAQSYKWPYEDYGMYLAHTGQKLPTHEHLRGLKKVDVTELSEIFSRALDMMMVKDPGAFFESVNDYYAELLELGLVSESTQVTVASLMSQPFVSAAKGCGAMGHDVVVAFARTEYKEKVLNIFRELGLRYMACEQDFDIGVHANLDLSAQVTEDKSPSLS